LRYRRAIGAGALVLLALTVLAVAGGISPGSPFVTDGKAVHVVAAAATSAPTVVDIHPASSPGVASAQAAIPVQSAASTLEMPRMSTPSQPALAAGPVHLSTPLDSRPSRPLESNTTWTSLQAACDEQDMAGASKQASPCVTANSFAAISLTSSSATSLDTRTDATASSMDLASAGNGSEASNVSGARPQSGLPILLAAIDPPAVTSAHPRMILDGDTLAALRQRMAANTAEWQSLKSTCDSFIGGTVNYPSQENYPDLPNLGQGYQGESYLPALLNEALCYQVLRATSLSAAAPYGAKAVDILMKMSTPYTSGGQGENPLADDGYVIRFYGVGFGLGYDWLYDLLTPAQRTQVYTTANAWLTAFEDPKGVAAFEYEHPQGNYFAGYFHAKAAIALGTYGENPTAPTEWADWLNNQFTKRVLPYYSKHLLGGGWPEGFGNYGPLAIFNMSMPAREVKTATGNDLVHAIAPFSFPLDSADYVMHFTWPSRAYFDDRDTNHSGGTATRPPGTVQVGLFQEIIGELAYWGSSKVPVFNEYMAEVNSATSGYDGADPWLRFLQVDPSEAKASLDTLPQSYFASGMGAVAARSDWTTGASWMSFRAGPYINNPGAGEEYFDQGSLALVRGATPLLVNAGGWVVHDPNGTTDETNVYNDNYKSGNTVFLGNRQLYNVFYVRNMSGNTVLDTFGQGAYTAEDDRAATKVAAYEDGGSYVYMLATHIEQMYRTFAAGPAVAGWARQVVYLRPNRFVVFDRTTSGNASYDQYMAWHFPANPVAGTAATGQKRLDVTYNGTYAGAMTTVLPANATTTTVPLYPNSNPVKAWQVQVRPPAAGVSQQWLTVFDLSTSAASVAAVSSVTIGQGAVVGVRLVAVGDNKVVISSSGTAGGRISGAVSYSVPASVAEHVVTDLAAATGYNITVSISGSNQTITVTPGGTFNTTAAGVLDFFVNAGGTIAQDNPTLPISSIPVGPPVPYKP
jgi:hypothetical protein